MSDKYGEPPNPIEPAPAHLPVEEDMSSSSEDEESDLEYNEQVCMGSHFIVSV